MLFRSYRKRKALASYRSVLGPRLRGGTRTRPPYEPSVVIATARFYQLSDTYLCYALAMYCDRGAFDAYHAERGDAACSYDRLRDELAGVGMGLRHSAAPADGSEVYVDDMADTTIAATADGIDYATDGAFFDAVASGVVDAAVSIAEPIQMSDASGGGFFSSLFDGGGGGDDGGGGGDGGGD